MAYFLSQKRPFVLIFFKKKEKNQVVRELRKEKCAVDFEAI